MIRFPRIYEIAQSKQMLVQEAYQIGNDSIKWTVNVSKNPNDWEVNEYEELLEILAAQEIKPITDKVTWKLEKRGVFSVESYHRQLIGGFDGGLQNFQTKQIWKVKVPSRIASFSWEACREGILTIDKLRARGQIIVNCCYLCLSVEESCNNLLLWCPMAYGIWNMICDLLGIDWVMSGTCGEIWAWEG